MNDTAQQLLKKLGLEEEKNVKVYIHSRQEDKYIEFQQNNRINDLL